MIRIVLVVLGLAACVESNVVPCGDGRVCPEGTTCEPVSGRCISEPQRAACEDRVEGASCTVAGTLGYCRDQVCATFACGNGVREGTERCDGLDLAETTCATLGYYGATTGLSCTGECQFEVGGCERTCGDDLVDPEEQCDGAQLGLASDCTSVGFYEPAGLQCSPSCRWDFDQCKGYCGDGTLNGPELCDGMAPTESCVDFGFDAGPSSCSSSCAASFEHCARFNWRAEPTGVSALRGMHAANANEQWIVGPDGFIARFVAGAWQQTPAPVTGELVKVWAAGGRAWAIARSPGILLTWNGATWQIVPGAPTATFVDVWGVGSTVFVATTAAGILSWDGTAWGTVGTLGCTPAVIRGTSPTNLWVGCSDALKRWNGLAWLRERDGRTSGLVVLDPETVVAVGTDLDLTPVISVREQGTWTTTEVPRMCIAVGASGPNDIWCSSPGGFVFHFDGQRIATNDLIAGSASTLIAISVLEPGTVIAASGDGLAFRFRGQMFADRGSVIGSGVARDVWGDGSETRFVVTSTGRVIQATDTGWSSPTALTSGDALATIWGASATDVWTGSRNGLLFRWDGAVWTAQPDNIGSVTAIFGTSAGDVWALAGTGPRHFDGNSWVPRPTVPADVLTVGASTGPNEVWAASATTLYRWTGAWSVVRTFTDAPTSISAPRADLVYVAASFRGLHYFDGASWHVVSLPVTLPVTKVVAFAPDDVFAATGQELVHFDGTTWSPIRISFNTLLEDLVAIKGSRGRLEILSSSVTEIRARSLLRFEPWMCRPSETDCADSIDDDCDGAIDRYDSDCP